MVTGGHGAREVSRCWLAGPRPENWRHDAAEKLRPRPGLCPGHSGPHYFACSELLSAAYPLF
eukprot:scaffold19477_cov61-Phaeocystis_antarctica.AAC.1